MTMNPPIIAMRSAQILVLAALQFVVSAHAAPGDLDETLGVGGKVTRDFFGNRDEARAVAIQPNGEIVVAGFARSGPDLGPDSFFEDFAVVRYEPDGTLDTGFGAGGDVLTDFGGQDRANALVIQPNGKILVVGGTCIGVNLDICDFALVRYNSDGTLDADFGSGGQTITHFPDLVTLPFGLAIQPDGAIVVGGWAFDGTGFDFALARYNGDGTLDTTFGDGGLVTTDVATGDDFGLGVVIQHTGKIVVSGTAFNGTTFDFAMTRYDADGTLDPTFGSGGKVLTDFGSSDEEIRDVALQADGKMIALGETVNAGGVAFALARYDADGAVDTDFGIGGLVTNDFGSGDAQGEDVVILPSGKILAAGGSLTGSSADFQLARYGRDGSLDVGFGVGGILTTDFFGDRDRALGVAAYPDGRIVLAGFAVNGLNRDLALARYLPR